MLNGTRGCSSGGGGGGEVGEGGSVGGHTEALIHGGERVTLGAGAQRRHMVQNTSMVLGGGWNTFSGSQEETTADANDSFFYCCFLFLSLL